MNCGTSANGLPEKKKRFQELIKKIYRLSDHQLLWIESIVSRLLGRKEYKLLCNDLFDECMLEAFGDAILVHHCLSAQPFTKDRFEYVLVMVARLCGREASLAPKGNPGHDVTINGERFSLKTQAERNIRPDKIHISKFMELGRGEWTDRIEDLDRLRSQFLAHLNSYDRILCLRAIAKPPPEWCYELVEIPKTLLQQARSGELKFSERSRHVVARSGYCYVRDETSGKLLYQLYFDGGGERKLQIQQLLKDNCTVHAMWRFPEVDFYNGEPPLLTFR